MLIIKRSSFKYPGFYIFRVFLDDSVEAFNGLLILTASKKVLSLLFPSVAFSHVRLRNRILLWYSTPSVKPIV
jgi:hypothetical protein